MVELFVVGFFDRTPSLIMDPAAYVAACKLPTAAKVERAGLLSVPNPPEGLVPKHRDNTHSSITAESTNSVCLGRPHS